MDLLLIVDELLIAEEIYISVRILRIILQHDYSHPHTAQLNRDKLEDLYRKVLPQPAISPELALADFYLFRSFKDLRGMYKSIFENYSS